MENNDADFLPATSLSKDERTWAMLCHLCIVGQIFFFPLILGPLVISLIKGDEMPFVKTQSKEAINFQITLFIAGVLCSILVFAFGLGFFLAGIVAVYAIVTGIIGAVKTNDGVPYRYGINLRLIN